MVVVIIKLAYLSSKIYKKIIQFQKLLILKNTKSIKLSYNNILVYRNHFLKKSLLVILVQGKMSNKDNLFFLILIFFKKK